MTFVLPAEQDRVIVVLVRARNPANIGAVARAMHDLGYSRLRVVNEFRVPFAAAKSAVHAESVLDAAVEYGSVAEAVADCTLVLGTTAIGERALEHPVHTLTEAVPLVQQTLSGQAEARVALLFGSEKTGLSNDELSHCHALLTIPMNTLGSTRHLSMNLGQAAAVCLYTLAQSGVADPSHVSEARHGAPDTAADGGALERLTQLMLDVFERSGYTRRHPANAREANVRRMVRRMALSPVDATMWSGILRQMLHALAAGSAEIPISEERKTVD